MEESTTPHSVCQFCSVNLLALKLFLHIITLHVTFTCSSSSEKSNNSVSLKILVKSLVATFLRYISSKMPVVSANVCSDSKVETYFLSNSLKLRKIWLLAKFWQTNVMMIKIPQQICPCSTSDEPHLHNGVIFWNHDRESQHGSVQISDWGLQFTPKIPHI